MSLESRYADGQLAALARLKLAFPAATHPVVQQSATLQSQAPKPMSQQAQQQLQPPTTPFDVSQLFSVHEQAHTRTEPMRKLSAEGMCTSCRKEKHYGSCARPIPIKRADFNAGMNGSDPTAGDNPAMSPHYHSATSADSALARARDGRPADEQAATYFADLFRHQGQVNLSDEPGRMTGGLNKVALTLMELGLGTSAGVPALAAGVHDRSAKSALGAGLGGVAGGALGGAAGLALDGLIPGAPLLGYAGGTLLGGLAGRHVARKIGGWQLWGTDSHSTHEDRGPTPNPYEERLTRKSPPVGFGDEGSQRIRRAFDQVDGAADTTNIGGGFGTPAGGPAVLG